MEFKTLISHIESQDLEGFREAWIKRKFSLSEKQKQDLLVEIVEYHYSDNSYSFYKKIMDLIIDTKVSLNFSIDHFAPTFLSLSVSLASKLLFDYLIRKGANINFVGNTKDIDPDDDEMFDTCFGFVRLKFDDLMSVNYNFFPSEVCMKNLSCDELESSDKVSVPKREYYSLVRQSQYLYDVIKTDELKDYIKSFGGKTAEEINPLKY